MIEPEHRPAYYSARPGGWRDWWTILHPPYTAWHLSYVVIGACLAPHVDGARLLATLAGVLRRRRHRRPRARRAPRSTAPHRRSRRRALVAAAVLGLAVAVAIGVVGVAGSGGCCCRS